jgi:hypothetical protein
MPDTRDLFELRKEHAASQDKLTYFLLAAAASGIAFAVNKTDGLKISWWLLPVACAAVCWAVSFFFGCQSIVWVQTALYANYSLLSLRMGVHPDQPQHPQELEAALSGVQSALRSNTERVQFYSSWQFRFLVIGAVLFILWRVLEMVHANPSA